MPLFREILIVIYLFIFKFVFLSFKLFPHKEKSVFITYFGYNALYTIEAMERIQENQKIIIIKTKHCRVSFQKKRNREIIDLSKFNLFGSILFVYHLATSKRVIVDNYYGFLAVTNFKKNTLCVQLWHAAGAIKRFGLTDVSVEKRSNLAKKRFKQVYNRFTHVVVGSDEMIDIFRLCFGLNEERMLKTGIPRTDYFYNKNEINRTTSILYDEYPILKEKKVILYAPTFRDEQNKLKATLLEIEKLYTELGDEYVLVLKTHPLVKSEIDVVYSDFLIDLSHYKNINHLLPVTDILISDYSSVPFEYSLFEKPMIFYAYDLEEYKNERGVWGNYEEFVGGPLASNTDDIIDIIKNNRFDQKQIVDFKNKWNKYSQGNSSINLAKFLLEYK